jgi:hypothetical protein
MGATALGTVVTKWFLAGRIDHQCCGPDGASRSSRTRARRPCGGMTGSEGRS